MIQLCVTFSCLSFDLRSYFEKLLLALLDKFFVLTLFLAGIVLKFLHKFYERKTMRYASFADENDPYVKQFSFAELLTHEQADYTSCRTRSETCAHVHVRLYSPTRAYAVQNARTKGKLLSLPHLYEIHVVAI